jgi:hypothetical protein
VFFGADHLQNNVARDRASMTSTKSVEQRMAAAANKARRDQDALKALRDYAADRARVDANTLRLRALRLQKEAADEQAAAELAAQKKVAGMAPKRKRSGTPA